MSVSRLPSGRWRAQVYDSRVGHNVAVSQILGDDHRSFSSKREAKAARAKAQEHLGSKPSSLTVRAFADRWTTDPLFARPKTSTNLHNAERIRAFVKRHGDLPLAQVNDQVVSEWIAGGKNTGSVSSLRAMFNDAASAKAGRLIQSNPFARLGLRKSSGNRHTDPPPESMVELLIQAARKQAGPSYAAWLKVACYTGMRPGELDALRWESVDFEAGRIRVVEQFSGKSRTFTLPKNGQRRDAPLTGQAREALLSLPRVSEFCFTQLRGGHWTASARAYHWKSVKAGAGYDGTLYVATRHFAGWYMVNVLGLPSEDCAIALGHTDGGQLVRLLYGHRDRDEALDRVLRAYESVGNVKPLRAVREDAS